MRAAIDCGTWVKIRPTAGEAESLSIGTARQIAAHNAKVEAICGAAGAGS